MSKLYKKYEILRFLTEIKGSHKITSLCEKYSCMNCCLFSPESTNKCNAVKFNLASLEDKSNIVKEIVSENRGRIFLNVKTARKFINTAMNKII